MTKSKQTAARPQPSTHIHCAVSTTNDRAAPSAKISAPRLPPGDLLPGDCDTHLVPTHSGRTTYLAIMYDLAVVSAKGARRWQHGHPWIYRSDVTTGPSAPAGAVRVARPARQADRRRAVESRRRRSRCAWWTARSARELDRAWWRHRIGAAIDRRPALAASVATRIVSCTAKRDACPSLICDRYDRWLVVQLMSAGLEAFRDAIVDSARRDRATRRHSRAQRRPAARERRSCRSGVELLRGDVPDEIEVSEHGVRFLAAPWRGQKTGAFLDQRENRVLDRRTRARPRARLLQLSRLVRAAPRAASRRASIAVDVSAEALARAARELRAQRHHERRARRGRHVRLSARATDRRRTLRHDRARSAGVREERARRFPARSAATRTSIFARCASSRPAACCSPRAAASISRSRSFSRCSHDAAADSGRRIALRAITGQPIDHPEVSDDS